MIIRGRNRTKSLPGLASPDQTRSFGHLDEQRVAVNREDLGVPINSEGAAAAADDTPSNRDPSAYPSPDYRTPTTARGGDFSPALPAGLDGGLVALPRRDPDRYQILAEHGRGGLGRVYRARDTELGRNVAVKELLQPSYAAEVRFFREAFITAHLEHPAIVPVHEAGRWRDGTPYYAMKLVSGRPLAELIADAKTLDDRLALLSHLIAVADAIAYAHARKIIHRDLKPSNVIVGDFGETIVIDWGLAKELATAEDQIVDYPYRISGASDVTVAGSVLGTPAYMSPEQARGEPVDTRTDVYSLGAMLYQLCTGEAPPANATGTDLRQRLRRVPEDLAAIALKSLRANAEDRYPNAGAFGGDLKAFVNGARIAAREYSLAAILGHWVRHHKRLTVSVAVSTMIAAVAAVFSVSEIVGQRDRASRALDEAKNERDRASRALDEAKTERDRAVLSEATVLLSKDPTRARDLLADLGARTPQHAWLLSRADQEAARHRVSVPTPITTLLLNPATSEVALSSSGTPGALYRLDAAKGTIRFVDDKMTGPIAQERGQWLFARRSSFAQPVTVVGTSGAPTMSVGGLLASPSSTILTSNLGTLALEPSGDLYRLDVNGPVHLRSGVRHIATDGDLLLTCALDGVLEVTRAGRPVLRDRCGKASGDGTMAVAGDQYAAQIDEKRFLLVRDGRRLELPIAVSGEYHVAVSRTGVFALADYNDRAWFVRPGRDTPEPGPPHTSQPFSVSARGRFAGWGYTDGTVVVVDTSSDKIWRFRGHEGTVGPIEIDDIHERVISATLDEVRVWSLRPPVWSLRTRPIGLVDCEIFNMARSADGKFVAFDCQDGSVRVWARETGGLRVIHRQKDLAFGVAWLRDMACSGSWDGRILCSSADGSVTREILSGHGRVRWITASPDHSYIVAATDSNRVYRFDGQVHELYWHNGPYRVAISADSRWLASVGFDGALVVYDLVESRVTKRIAAHTKQITAVAWLDDALWTSGADGAVKRWTVTSPQARVEESRTLTGVLRYGKVFRGGWTAVLDERSLLLADSTLGRAVRRIDVGREIYGVAISPDEQFIAAYSNGEVVVIDRKRHAVATILTGTDTYTFADFPDSKSLVVSTTTDMSLVPIDALAEFPFDLAETRSPHANGRGGGEDRSLTRGAGRAQGAAQRERAAQDGG
jgi:eukaryotic-like serine/threonine-protein kinase